MNSEYLFEVDEHTDKEVSLALFEKNILVSKPNAGYLGNEFVSKDWEIPAYTIGEMILFLMREKVKFSIDHDNEFHGYVFIATNHVLGKVFNPQLAYQTSLANYLGEFIIYLVNKGVIEINV